MPSYMWGTVLSSSSSKRLQHRKTNLSLQKLIYKKKKKLLKEKQYYG
jgi:hypothetical protein